MGQKTLDYEHMATLGCDVERSPAMLALDVYLVEGEVIVMAVKPSNTFRNRNMENDTLTLVNKKL